MHLREIVQRRLSAAPPSNSSRRFHRTSKSPSSNPERMLSLAQRSVDEGNLQAAEEAVLKVLADYPKHARAVAMLIDTYAKSGRVDDALEVFKSSEEDGSVNKDVYSSAIAALASAGRVRKARALLARSITERKQSGSGFASVMMAYARLKNAQRVQELFRQSEGFRTREVFEAAIFASCQVGRDRNAMRFFEMAGNQPKTAGRESRFTPGMFSYLIDEHMKAGKTAKASQLFWRSVGEGCCDAEVCKTAVRGYVESGLKEEEKLQNARRIFNMAVQRDVCDGELCAVMQNAYITASRGEDAKEIYDTAVLNGVDDKKLYQDLFDYYVKDGMEGKAVDLLLQQFHRHRPTEEHYKSITSALCSKGRYEAVLVFIAVLPEPDQRSPYLLLRKAEALMKSWKQQKAIDFLEEILQTANLNMKETESALTIMAQCLKETGQLDKPLGMFLKVTVSGSPQTFRYARIMCATVFVWERLGCTALDDQTLEFLNKSLAHYKQITTGELYLHTARALGILSKRTTGQEASAVA